MAQAPPFSVRLPEDVQARLDRAVNEGKKRNAVIVVALRDHFGMRPEATAHKIDTRMVPVFDKRRWLQPHPKPGAKK